MTFVPLALTLFLLAPVRLQDPPPTTPPVVIAPGLRLGAAEDALNFLRAIAPARQARITFELKMSFAVGEQTLSMASSGAIQLAPGHRMRSRIDFHPPLGMAAGQYEFLCDGKSVWVRDLKAKTWSKRSFAAFDKRGGDSIFLTGLFAGMADQVLGNMKLPELEKFVSDSLSDSERQEIEDAVLKDQGELMVGEEKVGDTTYQVFILQPKDQPDTKIRFYFDPASKRMDRLQVEGTSEKMRFTVTERILSVKPTTPTAAAFKFVPQGKQVPKISLGERS